MATNLQSETWANAELDRVRTTWLGRFLTRWWAGVLLLAFSCTVIGSIFGLSMVAEMGWRNSELQSLAQFWAWGLILPLIMAFDRRLPFSAKQLGRRACAHFAASLVVTFVYLYLFFFLQAVLGSQKWSALQLHRMTSIGMLGWFVWSLLVYWMIVGGLQAFRYYQRFLNSELQLERLEHSFSEARLNALRMQLDPHFLFNALNTISSHVERDPKLTRRMIEHLGDLLRMSLESKDRQEVPLAEELALLEHYLEIQKIRFGDQLRIIMDIAPEVKYAAVPSMLIQPLVENAIRHGISRRASGGTLTVRAKPLGDRLEIRVLDDGMGLPLGWKLEESEGLGLSITRQRIAGLHPNGASRFLVRNRAEGGTEVDVSLPLRLVGDEKDERAYA